MASPSMSPQPRRCLTRGDFRKVCVNGFGDGWNAYAHSMTWFRDHLYVGTTRANLANRALQIRKKTPERLNELVWPVRIPESYWENDLRAQIWRLEPKSGVWTKVYTSPLVKGKDGFDVPLSVGFRCMSVFQGESDDEALYVPTWASHQTPSSLMLRSFDGTDFEVVSEPGRAVPENKPRSFRGILPFRQYLVASPVVGQARFEPNIAGRTVLLASRDPARKSWKAVCEPGFGDPNNISAFHMAEFDGHLYAGTLNISEGFQIWKTAGDSAPPFRWKKVLGLGAGRGALNQIAMSLCPFRGALYVGTGIQNCSFDFDHNIGPAAPEIVRIYPDDTWDLVVGEPRLTSNGLKIPLSGLGAGFENPFAGYLWSLAVHDGWLYAGTCVWTMFMRYRHGAVDSLPEVLRSLFEAKLPHGHDRLESFLEQDGGCHLWRTRDGSAWVPVTQNGFDNCYNLGVRTQTSTPYGLFLGTANPFGPDVAVRRIAGFRYESNPTGGLEIWQGRVEEEWPRTAAPLRLRALDVGSHPRNVVDGRCTSERQAVALAKAFFDRTPWRAMGYWRSGVRGPSAACESLMAEVLAFLPARARRIVDVCARDEGVLRFLIERSGIAELVAVIDDRSQRLGAPQFARKGRASVLTREAFDGSQCSAAFDGALWVDGLSPRSVRLGTLLRQSASALEPGGALVAFETLRRPRPGRSLRVDSSLYAPSVSELRRCLIEAGFWDPTLVEATATSWSAFRENLSRWLTLSALGGEIPEVSLESVERWLCGQSQEIVGCVFIVAEKSLGGVRLRRDLRSREQS